MMIEEPLRVLLEVIEASWTTKDVLAGRRGWSDGEVLSLLYLRVASLFYIKRVGPDQF
jgi:hypothetical protein